MAINFPTSPSTNDTFTAGSITYKWDGAKWIGLGVTPADRLVEGSGLLEIESNNLAYTGGNFSIGTTTANNTLTLYGDSSSSLRISKSGVLAYDHTFDGSTYTIANNNGSAGIDIVFGTKQSGGESLRINASGQLITKGRIFINNTNGGFDYNTVADTLEVLTTSGSTHSEFNANAFVPQGTKNLGASNSRWNTLYINSGIDFAGNDNASGMTSELLDDYEEGTFEPIFRGASGTFNTVTYHADTGGRYTKVGNLVMVTGCVRINGGTLDKSNISSTDTLCIGGLPFNNNARTNGDNADNHGTLRCPVWSGSNCPQFIQARQNVDFCNLYFIGSLGGIHSTSQVSQLTNQSMVQFTLVYTSD